jgi:hypothetical protein
MNNPNYGNKRQIPFDRLHETDSYTGGDTEFSQNVGSAPASFMQEGTNSRQADMEYGDRRQVSFQRADETSPHVDRDTEFAQEVAPTPSPFARGGTERRRTDRENIASGRWLGITAIILAALSFFFLPYVLSIAGIAVGAMSIYRGNRLGWWAVSIGVVACLLTLLPLVWNRFY